MPRAYSIIADAGANFVPAVGTIVPSDMVHPEEVICLSLGGSFEPREFPALARFLEQWGYSPGELPVNGAQIRAKRIPVIEDEQAN